MLYYSAIKRNIFESVLMRWMKPEPIIQSEVSQKEKYKYYILTHIYGICRDGTDGFIFRVAMEKDIENRSMDKVGGEEGEGEMYGEKNTEIYKTTCETDHKWDLVYDSGNANRGSATG